MTAKTHRQLKKVQEYEHSCRRIHYDVGKLYVIHPVYKHTGSIGYYLDQPGELGYNESFYLMKDAIILCVEQNYLVEKPTYSSGVKWPISSFNGLTQGNLFLYENHIFFISISATFYDQRFILKELEITNDMH